MAEAQSQVAQDGLRVRSRTEFDVTPRIDDTPEVRRKVTVNMLASTVTYTGLHLNAHLLPPSADSMSATVAGGKKPIETMPAIKGDPPSPLQSAQWRIKRAVLHFQEIICGPLNGLADLAAVPRTIKKRSKN
jgi:hypothetical protein